MAVQHLVTKGFQSVPFLVTQGLGDYGGEAPEPEAVQAPVTYGGGDHDYEMRVRAWWDRIDALRSQNRERDATEAERKRAIEARRQELAEIEADKRRRAKKAQQARDAALQAIRADIAVMERQTMLLRAERAAVAAAIERIVAEIQAERDAFMAKRNAALVLLLLAD